MKTEKGFREEYSFLSNFARFDKPMVIHRGEGLFRFVFKTNEHFYQACKFTDYNHIIEVANHPSKGLKKYVNSLKSEWRDDWDDIKLSIMEIGLKYKFSEHNPTLRQKLIETKDVELIEYNYWNDKFFGVCLKTGEGENHLGKLLMQVRKEIS
ncbi:putative GTP cyclohydrolase II [Vibrio phage VPMCC14]|nr:putative GTP cyclohydrolase II [Vibrio phage VPMCC14]